MTTATKLHYYGGVRNTTAHQRLLSFLKSARRPVSVDEILIAVSANKTTIYRQLEKLMSEGLVSQTDLGEGKKRYELASLANHHHHLICTNCRKIECFNLGHDVEKQQAQLAEKFKFQILSHHLEFFGLCANCH